MSKPESIAVSLEMAKKLKAAGWPQEDSVFHWQWHEDDGEWPSFSAPSEWSCYQMEASLDDYDDGDCFAAPSAEEILRRLPEKFTHGEPYCLYAAITFRGHTLGNGWYVGYRNFAEGKAHPEIDGQDADTLANAMAKMYCYLADNKLLPSK